MAMLCGLLFTEKGTKTAGKDTIKLTCVLSLTKAAIHLNLATDQEIVLVTMGVQGIAGHVDLDMYFPPMFRSAND